MREYTVTSTASPFTPLVYCLLILTLVALSLFPPSLSSSLSSCLPLLPALLLLHLLSSHVTSESLLCSSSLGLQLTTRHYGGHSVSRFIDWAEVEGCVINEGVERWRVVDVLAVLVRRRAGQGGEGWVDGKKLVLVFGELRPRLCVLKQVWRGVREVMYHEPD